MELQVSSTLVLEPFTVYPLTLTPFKTCYEAEKHKILCSIVGPYFDRNNNNQTVSIQPIFNVLINQNQHATNKTAKNKQLIYQRNKISIVQQKVQELLKSMVVTDKYMRMKFDIIFQIIQNEDECVNSLYSPIVNLLCYTSVVNGLQIKSLFSCCTLYLNGEKITSQRKKLGKDRRQMTLAMDQLSKQSLLIVWQGEFNFLHYQKLANILMSSNDQIVQFIRQKINETYSQFS